MKYVCGAVIMATVLYALFFTDFLADCNRIADSI